MKKFFILFKKIDDTILINIKKIKTTFLGKLILKFMSEILLAVIISISIFFGQNIYDIKMLEKEEIQNIDNLRIGLNEKYIDSNFGIPEHSIVANNGIKNNYYKLNNCILRLCFSKSNVLVAYFITITDDRKTIDLDNHFYKNYKLGKLLFSDIEYTPEELDINIPAKGAYEYYSEKYLFGRPMEFCTFVFADLNYGILYDSSVELKKACCKEFFKDYNIDFESISSYRNTKPNTFGVIAAYCDEIDIILITKEEEWYYIYNSLCK